MRKLGMVKYKGGIEMKRVVELGLELIQLEDQVLLVDKKSRIKIGDFLLGGSDDESYHEIWENDGGYISDEDCKVIASTKPLEGLPLLVIEDEVDKKILDAYMNSKDENIPDDFELYKSIYKDILSNHPYSEEDMKRAYNVGLNTGVYIQGGSYDHSDNVSYEEFIQSHNEKELWIEVIMIDKKGKMVESNLPKIINNTIKGTWRI